MTVEEVFQLIQARGSSGLEKKETERLRLLLIQDKVMAVGGMMMGGAVKGIILDCTAHSGEQRA